MMETIMNMFETGSSYADIAKAVGKTEREIEVIIHYTYRQEIYYECTNFSFGT